MASDWRVDVLRGLGAPLTKQNISFLTNWQRYEGGHTNNAARWNWLNTTRNAPGAVRSINSVGVKAFDTYESGVAATIQTLNSGYYKGIVEGLRSGKPSSSRVAAQGLATWVAGPNAAPGVSARYVGNVLGIDKQEAWHLLTGSPGGGGKPDISVPTVPKARGQGNASVRVGGQSYGGGRVSPQQQLAASDADEMYRQAVSGFLLGRAEARARGETPTGGLLSLAQLRSDYQAMGGIPEAPQARTTADKAIRKTASSKSGGQPISDVVNGHILIPSVIPGAGTHITDNLDWNNGRKTARDIMADPGTMVGAPEDGTVLRLGSAQGGESMYFKGKSGRLYWLGHITNFLPVGATRRAGQPIARIADQHVSAPHLHFDYKL